MHSKGFHLYSKSRRCTGVDLVITCVKQFNTTKSFRTFQSWLSIHPGHNTQGRQRKLQSNESLGVAGSNPAGRATIPGLIFALTKSDAISLMFIYSGVKFDAANHVFAGHRTKHCVSSQQYCRVLLGNLIGKIGLSYKIIRGRRHL